MKPADSSDKPSNISEYKTWLKDSHGVELKDKHETHYGSVLTKIKSDIEKSPVWEAFKSDFGELGRKYYIDTGYHLGNSDELPTFVTKPYDSFLLKTFRKNILNNKQWPDEPTGGWLLPENWFGNINDLVRTNITVKYLDGVEYLENALCEICNAHGANAHADYEAKEEGYYAAHCYFSQVVEIPKLDWETEELSVEVEVQITTQLQEVIKKLLHVYYEERRGSSVQENYKWQWDYKSEEFSTNYLGHILHYIEGMIMEIRDKQEKKKDASRGL